MEGGDYEEVSYVPDHDFGAARVDYDAHAGRSYKKAKEDDLKEDDLLPRIIRTDAETGIILSVDHTGSMGDKPGIVYDKFPYLVHEAQTEYLPPNSPFCVASFGDAREIEDYPLQARPFAGKQELPVRLKELVLVPGSGGAGMEESSELMALYALHSIRFGKKAGRSRRKPVYIMITDECCYRTVNQDMAAKVYVKTSKGIAAEKIFRALHRKYEAFLILMPYGGASNWQDRRSQEVKSFWLDYFDEDHTAYLEDARRIVDVIFGLLAKAADRREYFEREIMKRQVEDVSEDERDEGRRKVDTVFRSLGTVHRGIWDAGGSTMFRRGKGKAAKPPL